MQQLTIRGLDPELEKYLRQLARNRDLSLNKAALLLMRHGAGLEQERRKDVVGDSVDHLIGTWSERDEAEFKAATLAFEQIDDELWS